MKIIIDKLLAHSALNKLAVFLVPFIAWIFCFRYFFNGHLNLEADAISYAQHIGIYTDNLCKGVYPLWDPDWFSGSPNNFFLRRIGDLNPLLFIIVILKWVGVSSSSAYLIFLVMYFFLAGLAVYLITKFLLDDRFYAFTAYIIFLFSSWSSQVFYNYIIIIFVPIIWFFYFLLAFGRRPSKGFLLGMFFCVGLIITTYIPFFFLTILAIFSFFFLVFYGPVFVHFCKISLAFILKNKLFTVFCVFFLLISCVPALKFYQESKSGEFVLPNRHSGADSSSAVAVGMDNVANGDIISHGYFDRVFDDHAHIDMGDIYIPYLFFLILLTTALGKVNKLIFFLLFNIFAISLITITSTAGVHQFLYKHILFFKFIRNIYYFFWLAMLPLFIILAAASLKSLLISINDAKNKFFWLVYIVACHLLFTLFIYFHQGVLPGAWIAIFLSLVYFLSYFFCKNRFSYVLGFILFFLSAFIQSTQVFDAMNQKLYKSEMDVREEVRTHTDYKKPRLSLYYACHWFQVLVEFIDPNVLDNYRAQKFIFVDNVVPYVDSLYFYKSLEASMSSNDNIAYVPKDETNTSEWQINPNALKQSDRDALQTGKLSVLHADANTLVMKTHLSDRQFLVINDNFNSNWHAFLNGKETPLLRTNVSFKGLWLPPGDSHVMLRYGAPASYLFSYILIFFFFGTFFYLLILLRSSKDSNVQ